MDKNSSLATAVSAAELHKLPSFLLRKKNQQWQNVITAHCKHPSQQTHCHSQCCRCSSPPQLANSWRKATTAALETSEQLMALWRGTADAQDLPDLRANTTQGRWTSWCSQPFWGQSPQNKPLYNSMPLAVWGNQCAEPKAQLHASWPTLVMWCSSPAPSNSSSYSLFSLCTNLCSESTKSRNSTALSEPQLYVKAAPFSWYHRTTEVGKTTKIL